ncbi:septum formation initiator family protein [candidate division KSB1 bacterium]|nr:septum formation initiator family protein [candidate division KSB1 bacterium]
MARNSKKPYRRARLVVFLGLLALLFLLSTGSRGFVQQIRLQQQKRQLEREIVALKQTIEALEAERQKLYDPAEIERIAREKYGMAKKNEKILRVVPMEED